MHAVNNRKHQNWSDGGAGHVQVEAMGRGYSASKEPGVLFRADGRQVFVF